MVNSRSSSPRKPACAFCRGRNTVKNGHSPAGRQVMLCRNCGKRFVLEPRRARYDDVFKHHVLAALGDGLNASTAQRVFKVRRQTITAWQQKAASDDPSPQLNTKDRKTIAI